MGDSDHSSSIIFLTNKYLCGKSLLDTTNQHDIQTKSDQMLVRMGLLYFIMMGVTNNQLDGPLYNVVYNVVTSVYSVYSVYSVVYSGGRGCQPG